MGARASSCLAVLAIACGDSGNGGASDATTSSTSTSTSSSSDPATSASTSSTSTGTSGTTSTGTTTGGPAAGELELIGHHDLGARGMNAALAVAGGYAYVGSRIDGVPHPDTGVLIVDVADPAQPELVGQIGPPEQALLGMTSRELRAIEDQDLLIVLNFPCHDVIHGCTRDLGQYPATGGAAETPNIKFYDISDGAQPALIARHDFVYSGSSLPHEIYLWRDPNDAARVLLFVSVPLLPPALHVLDISDLGDIQTVTTWDPHEDGGLDEPVSSDSLLHSVALSDDGQVGFLSMVGSGLLLIDISEVASGLMNPSISLLHDVAARVDYSPPAHPGTHSAVPIPGRDLVLITDEVYPQPLYPGCPWGWARIVDHADPAAPMIAGEYAIAQNDVDRCAANAQPNATYTAHNATVTEHLALIAWHAGGFHVVDTTDPALPTAAAIAMPDPLAQVTVEDPIMFGEPVTMWSYPIIVDGLIYVVDVRNGLYVYAYTGPYEDEIASLAFAEGNSNLQ